MSSITSQINSLTELMDKTILNIYSFLKRILHNLLVFHSVDLLSPERVSQGEKYVSEHHFAISILPYLH